MTHSDPREEELQGNPEAICVFSYAGKSVNIGDILKAAAFRGELQKTLGELLRKIHCETISEDSDLEADEEKLQAVADQIRYERDLISAEETEAWLEMRGLTMEDFHGYITRTYWKEHLADREVPDPADFVTAISEHRDLLRVEMLISGQFERAAAALGWRIAARLASNDSANANDVEDSERKMFLKDAGIEASAIKDWLDAVGTDETWLQEMLRMEAAYREHCAAALSHDSRMRMLSSLRLPLTLIEMESIEFDRSDAANEGYLCVQEDGLCMEEAAQLGRYPYEKREVLVEDLPAHWQRKLLGASEGFALEPEEGDGGVFHLCRVLRKREPQLDDPSVKDRVDARLLESHFADLTGKLITWSLR